MLEPAGPEHLDLLTALNGDPEVMRFLLGRAATRAEVEEEWSRRLGPWSDAERGLGYWVGFAGGEFAGWWSASSYEPEPAVAGIGYRLARSAWGQGLATEGARAMVAHAFAVPGIERCVASTMAVNLGSRRVLEKAGFLLTDTYVGEWDDPLPGWEHGEVVYAVTRRDWLGAMSHARAMWDAEAADFDEPADHGLRDPEVRDAWRALLVGVLPPAPARVADLGCGTGTLTRLLAEEGYAVDAVDFSPAMVRLARDKTADLDRVTVIEGDAGSPPLEQASYDVVLCRHVLWALPDQVEVLRRWTGLLAPGGRLVLVEGNWSNGAGLTADRTVALLAEAGREASVRRLAEAAYWGREISDERYLVVS